MADKTDYSTVNNNIVALPERQLLALMAACIYPGLEATKDFVPTNAPVRDSRADRAIDAASAILRLIEIGRTATGPWGKAFIEERLPEESIQALARRLGLAADKEPK